MARRVSRVQKRYEVLLIDSPWQYNDKNANGKRGAGFKYEVLKPKDIINLPVQNVAADDCALFMWTTSPMMHEALHAIDAYGFNFKTLAYLWVKTNKNIPLIDDKMTPEIVLGQLDRAAKFGLGHWTRSSVELCLLATRGRPKRVSKSVRQTVFYPALEHSAKPPIVRDRIVELMGDVPRLELFARERAVGWDATGLELDGVDVRDYLSR